MSNPASRFRSRPLPATSSPSRRSSATRWKAVSAKDKQGKLIPRHIINRFTCDFNGQNVIDITLEPAISTNPYIQFSAKVPEAGEFVFKWFDDDGSVYEERKTIAVA